MLPPTEILDALDLATADITEAGGATGRLWKVDTGTAVYALRLAMSERSATAQVAAMQAAAAGGIPVPELVRHETTVAGIALVHSWMPGTMASEAMFRDHTAARRIGRAAGEAHRLLHDIRAPEHVFDDRRWAAAPFDPLPSGNQLLHLDFHPNNILIGDSGRVCGILDWENAAAGDPLLDLARTQSIMTLDPVVPALPPKARVAAGEFLSGWLDGYGKIEIPIDYQVWAARVMLRDLGKRHSPDALQHLHEHIETLAR